MTYIWTARSGVRVISCVPRDAGENPWMDSHLTGAFVSWYRWYRNIRRAYGKVYKKRKR